MPMVEMFLILSKSNTSLKMTTINNIRHISVDVYMLVGLSYLKFELLLPTIMYVNTKLDLQSLDELYL